MRNLTRLPLALAAIASFNLTGAAVLAESPVPDPFPSGPVFGAELCNPIQEFCPDPTPDPDPDPVPNPNIPSGPGVLTDDPCDPVEGPCGPGPDDPETNPDIPEGPGELTDDPCDPVEGPCGPGPDDPETNPDIPEGPGEFTDDLCDPAEADCSDSDPDPEPEPCPLDEVCTRTPTFTG